MSLVASYTGRTYDVSAFRGQQAAGAIRLDASLAGPGDSGEAITGTLKVAQWFLIEFLTALGSLPYDPSRGTSFVPSLISGALQTETDVFVAFSFAVGNLTVLAAQLEPETAPLDEQFATAVLNSVLITPGVVQLSITLTTMAGASRAIILPIAMLP
jgi:hypothetical protein